MSRNYVPKLNLELNFDKKITQTKFYPSSPPIRLNSIDENNNNIPSFAEVIKGMATEINQTVKAPDQMLHDMALGKGPDIHDVMVSISKADITINMTTAITTKVVQSYDKIMQIQV